MNGLIREQIRFEFARGAEIAREEKERLAREFAWRQRDKLKKEEAEEKESQQEFVELVLLDQELSSFTAKLDEYDRATVEALMENGVELEAVRREIDEMLMQAETLPDGRRVFKTRDGKKVFDEHGIEVKADEIKPGDIDDRRPRWEEFKALRDREESLETERGQLLKYQEKLDDARERADDPDLTHDEMKALEKDLEESAPERVRRKVGAESDGPATKPAQGQGQDQALREPQASSESTFFQRRAELSPP